MKLKPGRYRVDIESPFLAVFDSLSERVGKVTAWLKKAGAKVESYSPMPPSSVRITFTLPKAAKWSFDFATPKASKPLAKAVPWKEAKKTGRKDEVDEVVDTVKGSLPQIGLLLLLLALATRGNR